VALLLRVVAFQQMRDVPNATSDGLFYEEVAGKIVDGTYLQERKAFDFSPLYVFFLAGVFKALGHSLDAVRVVQILLGLGSCALIFRIAGRLLGREAALVALWLTAAYVPFIHFEMQLLGITLGVFLMLLSLELVLAAADPPRPRLLVPAGLCLGLASLSAPTLLVLGAPVAAWMAMRRQGGARIALFVGSLLLGILPATIWNYRATGELVLVSSQGGVNFYIGNNPEAPGYFVVPPGMEDSLAGINVTGARKIAEAEAKRPLSAREVSRHWSGRALSFIVGNPIAAARLFLRKVFLFVNRYETPLDLDQQTFREYLPLLGWPLLSFGVVSVLGGLGVALAASRRDPQRDALLLMMLATYALAVVAFFVSDRYRLPAVPLLILLAASALQWGGERVRAGQSGRVVSAATLALLVGVFVVYAPVGFEGSRASIYFNVAQGHLRQNDLARARVELEKCVQQDPAWLEARYKLALAHHELGDHDRALEEVDVVVARAPRSPEARLLKGKVLLRKGLPRLAARELEEALSLSPENSEATSARQEAERAPVPATAQRIAALGDDGWRRMESQQFASAIASFEELLALAPADKAAREKALAGMGFSYARQGRIDLAIRVFTDAAAVSPDNPIVQKNLALLHLKQGRRDEARPFVERYAQLNPGDPMLAELRAGVSAP
jgi:tetratricopeptide (TPR) repeat protein